MSPIADFDERKPAGELRFRKTEYLSLEPGEHTIRFAEEKAQKQYAHWVGRTYLECIGESCPVCHNNKQIIYEHPEDFKTVPGYSYKRERFAINVLDKTNPESVELRVLTGSRPFFEDIDLMAQATRDEGSEVVDLRGYDWKIIVMGKGRERTVTLVPQYRGKCELPNLEGYELFDTSKIIVSLTEEEIKDAMKGVSLKDIFALRRATKEVVNSVSPDSDVARDVAASVDSIFKTG